MSETYVDIVFDGPPGPLSGRFIEAEDPDGSGTRVGDWIERPDGYWALRIPLEGPSGVLGELCTRLDAAAEQLNVMARTDLKETTHEQRLVGKAQGVLLAKSYIEEVLEGPCRG